MSTLLWIVVVVAAIVLIWYTCDRDRKRSLTQRQEFIVVTQDPTDQSIGPLIPPAVPCNPETEYCPTVPSTGLAYRHGTAKVTHNDPFLLTLFMQDIELLPKGVSREQFERAVDEYERTHLKTPEVQIPRSINFNYDKYTSSQEEMQRNVAQLHGTFIQRDEIGQLAERVLRAPTKAAQGQSFSKRGK